MRSQADADATRPVAAIAGGARQIVITESAGRSRYRALNLQRARISISTALRLPAVVHAVEARERHRRPELPRLELERVRGGVRTVANDRRHVISAVLFVKPQEASPSARGPVPVGPADQLHSGCRHLRHHRPERRWRVVLHRLPRQLGSRARRRPECWPPAVGEDGRPRRSRRAAPVRRPTGGVRRRVQRVRRERCRASRIPRRSPTRSRCSTRRSSDATPARRGSSSSVCAICSES
jgi:hypothetical protein